MENLNFLKWSGFLGHPLVFIRSFSWIGHFTYSGCQNWSTTLHIFFGFLYISRTIRAKTFLFSLNHSPYTLLYKQKVSGWSVHVLRFYWRHKPCGLFFKASKLINHFQFVLFCPIISWWNILYKVSLERENCALSDEHLSMRILSTMDYEVTFFWPQ